MRKPCLLAASQSPGARSISSTCSTRAAAGACSDSAATKPSSASTEACASMCTPSPALSTQPQMPCAIASRYTNGRMPTPCTMPVTWICTCRMWLPLVKTDQKGTGLFWSVKFLNLPKQTCPFLAGALRETPLQPQALLSGGAGELAVLNAAQAQQAVG